jgi:iron-sulfur cluster repair protein YtfE (RIC family)
MDLVHDHRLIVTDFELLRVRFREREVNCDPHQATLLNRLVQSLDEHFRKEERLLFPLLRRSLGQSICNELSNEHLEIMSMAEKFSEQKAFPDEPLRLLETLLQKHFAREENVLFWYLDVRGLTDRDSDSRLLVGCSG